MGNAESSSSSQFPGREDDDLSSDNRRAKKPGQDEQEESSSSAVTALKVGAAVAGSALLALGAWNLGKSLSSSDESDGQKTAQGGGGSILEGAAGYGYAPGGSFKLYSDEPKPYPYYMRKGLNLNGGIIKIMSYNVWPNQELELHKRMKAIGGLIVQHDPDVIFLQEITPTIYDIFQSSNWWTAYQCSVSPEKAESGTFFCMLLTKLPPRSFYCQPIAKNSNVKELCAADIDVGTGQTLTVATAHLKSPAPPFMYRIQRMEQAKTALNLLEDAAEPNVIFGGDMNWDEKLDGPFPLLDGWVDAWDSLTSGEEGWTYDSKLNKMLDKDKPLRKRLDRFICKLKDFELMKVERIGMEAIPGLFYLNEGTLLPVFPSDHYGLLLTIKLNKCGFGGAYNS